MTLQKALLFAISQVEAERFKDKERLKAIIGKKPKKPVLDELATLRESIQKIGPEEAERLEPEIARVEKAYIEMRDMLVTAASTGLSLGAVIHNAEKIIKNLRLVVRKEPVPVEQIRSMVYELARMIDGLTFLMKKDPPAKESLKILVDNTLFNLQHRFALHKINIINGFDFKRDISVTCSRSFVGSAITNLVDNSIWWLDNKGHDDKVIYIGPSLEFKPYPALIIGDNGPGFMDDAEDLVRPFFTRKQGGMGLGLFLVDEIMNRQRGRLEFPDSDDLELPAEIDGAVVALVFNKE